MHIDNLVEPSFERKFRSLDFGHVKEIKENIIQRPECKNNIMLGNVDSTSHVNVTELMLRTSGEAIVEVIGGNHTRMAIVQIRKLQQHKHNPCFSLWPVKIYSSLNQLECQKLGFEHNLDNECVKPNTSIDILHFFRKELLTICKNENDQRIKSTGKESKLWKANITHVLQIPIESLHNKHKTLLILSRVGHYLERNFTTGGKFTERKDYWSN